jgi:signal transduction histidine kinase
MKTRILILAPLLVMVLLTFLVGGTAYQQTLNWEKGVTQATNNISRLVILNNIQWGLRKMKRELTENPEQAKATWQEMQREVLVLLKLRPQNTDTLEDLPMPSLQKILQTQKPTQADLKILLKSELLALSLDQVNELKYLQTQAEWVTRLMTVSMIILGLVLTILTAYDLDRMIQQLARSRDLNIRLQEEERRRIAQDLHDGVVQELVDLKRNYEPQKVDNVINNLRRVCHNLKPQVLEDLGLAAALEFLADDLRQEGITNVQITLDEDGLAQLPKHYELPLFRVVQELCSNIKHHAQATQVNMTIAYNPMESPALSGFIGDNGKGFNPNLIHAKGMGLTGVKERIQQVEGTLKIQSKVGQGSQFHFIIPVKKNAKKSAFV